MPLQRGHSLFVMMKNNKNHEEVEINVELTSVLKELNQIHINVKEMKIYGNGILLVVKMSPLKSLLILHL